MWLSLFFTQKNSFHFKVESSQFYTSDITCSLETLDDSTVGFVKLTQWLSNYPGINQIVICRMNLDSV